MVMVKLKGVAKVKARGQTYYYAWRGGPRLVGEPGSDEFMASLQEARNPLAGIDQRKFGAYVVMYRASDEYKGLADSTKYRWRPWLDEVKKEFGGLSVRQFDRPLIRVAIRKWRDKWKKTPRTADFGKQVLSRVCSFAVAEGAITTNPCVGVPNLYEADRSDIIWEKGDLDALCAKASKEVAWAARLAALTGLRYGDLFKLAWSHVGEHAIEIKTGKSRRRKTATIPITAELRALLDTIPKRATTVLTNSDGRPWKGFGSSWNKAMARTWPAGRDLHFHDLRGTAATTLYGAGLTTREIAEIMAWSEDRVERLIDRYVKRDEILKDRIRRMEASRPGTR